MVFIQDGKDGMEMWIAAHNEKSENNKTAYISEQATQMDAVLVVFWADIPPGLLSSMLTLLASRLDRLLAPRLQLLFCNSGQQRGMGIGWMFEGRTAGRPCRCFITDILLLLHRLSMEVLQNS